MELNALLAQLVEKKATILHLVGGAPPLMRNLGSPLSPLVEEILSPADVKAALEAILSPSQKETLERDREVNAAYGVERLSRFRVSIFYQRGTLAGIFRLTPAAPQSLESLGLPSLIKDSVAKPQGLVLIVGPKRSGKSQTLAAILDYLMEAKSMQIVSLEDPIEMVLRNKRGVIYQREIGTDVPDFKQGLATALRQSPDVLALSDLPDYDTVAGVLSVAAAGQLVIATMTANGVVSAFELMLEMAPPHFQQAMRSLLANSLELAVGQLLVNKKGGGGLAPAFEILAGTMQSRNLIRDNKLGALVQYMNNNREAGMVSQELALKNLARKGTIDMDEAISKAARPEELRRLAALPI